MADLDKDGDSTPAPLKVPKIFGGMIDTSYKPIPNVKSVLLD
jgi:hypothetical protein